MNFIKNRIFLSGLLLLTTANVLAQQSSPKTPAAPSKKEATPAQKAPAAKNTVPEQPKADKKPDQAAAYYHFSLAHMYEEMMAMYGRSEYATKAIEEYRQAIENDPSSEYLNASLGDLQPGTQSREVLGLAIEQYEAITKIEPKSADNHLLLGRLYFLNKDAV